jgi:hypothetical protein
MVILYVLSRAAIDDGRFMVNLTTEGKRDSPRRTQRARRRRPRKRGEDRGREEKTEEERI